MNRVAKTLSLVAMLLAPNTVRGGGGFDICYVDKYDRVKGCEQEY